MNRTFLNMKSFGLAILALAASAPLSAQSLQPSTTSITLQAPGSAAVEQTFSVTITGNTQNQPLQVVAAGGSWLTVAPQSLTGTQACVVAGTANTCTTPVGGVQINNPGASVTFRAVANPTAPQVLSPGTYTGQFTLQLAGTGVFASVSVNFTVGSTANTISVTTPGGTPVSQINFNAAPNQTTAAQS
ncbi:MAG: hypothetical protein K2Q23_07655, partial [Bryobacteraceae bacterium]|nr:hypothetical protein [Bryobacteraceae bacterium]